MYQTSAANFITHINRFDWQIYTNGYSKVPEKNINTKSIRMRFRCTDNHSSNLRVIVKLVEPLRRRRRVMGIAIRDQYLFRSFCDFCYNSVNAICILCANLVFYMRNGTSGYDAAGTQCTRRTLQ